MVPLSTPPLLFTWGRRNFKPRPGQLLQSTGSTPFSDMNTAKEYLKARATKGLRSAVRQLQEEWRISRRHRRSVKKVPQVLHGPELKLNLRCGPQAKPG